MQDIRLIDQLALTEWLKSQGEPAFRSNQVWSWIWHKYVVDFEHMRNIPNTLRQKLSTNFHFRPLVEDFRQQSEDGTIKVRFQLHDGHKIESVLIPVPADNRFTVCVSTQVGCSLTCKFCATGRMGRIRNLDFPEIVEQVVLVNAISEDTYGHRLTNIVYMGMGEPLLNYSNTLKSIEKITMSGGLNMSPTRITVSTAGIAKMIKKMADDATKVNLALSLHAAIDEKRDQIMPINDQNNIEVLMDALTYYYQKTKNRITYEYLALQNFNDSIDDANQLARLTKHFPVRVNIIEYNTVEGKDFTKTPIDQLNKFAARLADLDVNVTVRRSRGKDIDAACGQLANKN